MNRLTICLLVVFIFFNLQSHAISSLFDEIPEFRVNEFFGYSGVHQYYPVVAANARDQAVVCWVDMRDGLSLFAQCFDSTGVPVGANFRVNPEDQDAVNTPPAVVVDDSGGFVIAWMSVYHPGLVYQRFNNRGEKTGDLQPVGDEQITHSNAALRFSADGNLLIASICKDQPGLNYSINLSQFSPDDQKLFDLKINETKIERIFLFYKPAILYSPDGRMGIFWTNNQQIWGQWLDAQFNLVGGNFIVSEAPVDRYSAIRAAQSSEGTGIVIWHSEDHKFMIQRFARDGSREGNNFSIPDMKKNYAHGFGVAPAGNEGFLFSWAESPALRMMYFGKDGRTKMLPDVNEPQRPIRDFPALFTAGNKTLVVWSGLQMHVSYDISLQCYVSDSVKQGPNQLVNDDGGNSDQSLPEIATDAAGNFMICWEDESWGGTQIFGQRFDPRGQRIGANFPIRSTDSLRSGRQPGVIFGPDGDFFVCWNEPQKLWLQHFNAAGTPQEICLVNESNCRSFHNQITVSTSGNFVVCWGEGRYDENNRWIADILVQRFNADGQKIGGNIRITDKLPVCFRNSPDVALDAAGNFLVCWSERQRKQLTIFAQRFDASGERIGEYFQISTDTTLANEYPRIAMAPGGNFAVCWREYAGSEGAILTNNVCARFFDAAGNPASPKLLLDNSRIRLNSRISDVAMDSAGNCCFSWETMKNNERTIAAQFFSADGTPQGESFLLSQADEFTRTFPAIALRNGNLYSTWMDYRNHRFTADIWARVVDLNNSVAVTNRSSAPPLSAQLLPNFPNPFNPVTTLSYSLTAPARVKLSVVDLLGREVAILVNRIRPAGNHTVKFSAKNLATGIYFARLEINSIHSSCRLKQIRKMVFIR